MQGTNSKNKKNRSKNYIFDAEKVCNEAEKSKQPKGTSDTSSIWGRVMKGINSKHKNKQPKNHILVLWEEATGVKSRKPQRHRHGHYQVYTPNFNF